jgi:hypothetical protein
MTIILWMEKWVHDIWDRVNNYDDAICSLNWISIVYIPTSGTNWRHIIQHS